MSNQARRAHGTASTTARYLTHHEDLTSVRPRHGPTATRDEVRFTVWLDELPFEFLITRQALEDIDGSRGDDGHLLDMFLRHRQRVENIAMGLIDAGAKWPQLIIRMQDVH